MWHRPASVDLKAEAEDSLLSAKDFLLTLFVDHSACGSLLRLLLNSSVKPCLYGIP